MIKREAAKYLGVSTKAIERYSKRGLLTVSYHIGKHGREAHYQDSELEQLRVMLHSPATLDDQTGQDRVSQVVGSSSLDPSMVNIAKTGQNKMEQGQTTTSTVSAKSLIKTRRSLKQRQDKAGQDKQAETRQDNISELIPALHSMSESFARSIVEAFKAEISSMASTPAPLADLAVKLTLSIAEASRLSGISEAGLSAAIKKGKIKTLKIEKDTLIKRADLEKYIGKL